MSDVDTKQMLGAIFSTDLNAVWDRVERQLIADNRQDIIEAIPRPFTHYFLRQILFYFAQVIAEENACPMDGHVWDGEIHSEGNMTTATCSKCGMWAINFGMRYLP